MASSPENNKDSPSELNSEEILSEEPDDQKVITGAGELERESPTIAADAASDGKISLFLKATSDVPIMKKKKWQVDENKTVLWIISFIKRYLKLEERENIFLYVAQAFAPSPDQQIKNLYECFGAEGKLVLHYSKTPAWG